MSGEGKAAEAKDAESYNALTKAKKIHEKVKANREPSAREKDILTRIQRDRVALSEIVITGVLFGLALNLISNFLSGLPTLITDFVPFWWSFSLAIGSGLITLYLFVKLSRQHLSNSCTIKQGFNIVLCWDRSTGNPLDFRFLYGPQWELRKFFDYATDEQSQELKSQLVSGDLSGSLENSPLLFLFEVVLFQQLGMFNSPYGGMDEKEYSYNYVLGKRNPLVRNRDATALFIPGDINVDYAFKNNVGKLKINWKGDYHGKIEISFRPYVSSVVIVEEEVESIKYPSITAHLPFYSTTDHGTVSIQFHVDLAGTFSPVRLQLGKKNVRELIVWTQIRFDWLQNILAWDEIRETARLKAGASKYLDPTGNILVAPPPAKAWRIDDTKKKAKVQPGQAFSKPAMDQEDKEDFTEE
jgi:hypothetical protein